MNKRLLVTVFLTLLLGWAMGSSAAQSGRLDAGGLWITRLTPAGPAGRPFDVLQIQFSAAVMDGSFTLDDVTVSGPGGPIVPLDVTRLADDCYQLNLTGLTGLSSYSLEVGPEVLDTGERPMDQDHDGTAGEPEDVYTGALFSAGVTIADGQVVHDGKNLVTFGSSSTIDGAHRFASVEVLGGATLSHSATTASAEYRVDLTITDTIWIASGAKIDVSNRGYLSGRTVGNTTLGGPTGHAGGSYGGMGYPWQGVPNRTYGDYRSPNELGSGGGDGDGNQGRPGGGLVRITAGSAVIDGQILADGADASYPANMGGSGGGILLEVVTLSGTGTLSAEGGVGGNIGYRGGSGGGGRIAIYCDTVAGLDLLTQVKAHGGDYPGDVLDGAVGTIYLKPDDGDGQLRLDSHGAATNSWTPLGQPSDTTFVVDHLVLSGANVVAAPEHQMPIFANNVSMLSGANLTHQATTTSAEYSLQMTVADALFVDAGAKIDASGRGYLGGRTVGNTSAGGSTGHAGGSYGGLGYPWEGVPNRTYGDYRNPNELGSGGGAGSGNQGRPGGGLVRITAGSAVIDGQILADGADASNPANVGGSGGGILLDVVTLSGTGALSAEGGRGGNIGYGGGSGGGGRIAIYYHTVAGFDLLTQVKAHGGDYPGDVLDGAVGTVYLKPGDGDGQLRVDSHGAATNSWTPLGQPGDGSFVVDHLVVSGANVVAAPEHEVLIVAGDVSILNGAKLTHLAATVGAGYSLRMTIAGALVVDTGSKIDVSGKGYLGGRTVGNTTIGAPAGSAGGSYGGLGHPGGSSGVTNRVYGDYRNPNELGSGGGMQWGGGAPGGGLVRITAGSATIDGQVLSNGAYSRMNPAGSGGGILLDVGELAGSGTIAANGGTGSSVGNNGGSGGGGRVAIYYQTLGRAFSPATQASAHGAVNDYANQPSAAGTVFLQEKGGEGQLRVDSHGTSTGVWTPLGQPSDASFVVDHLVLSGVNVVAAPEHEMPIAANNVSILGGANLTHQAATRDQAYSLRMIVAGALTIQATGKIDASGRGYLPGYTSGNTLTGARGDAGGSHGGLGNPATGSTSGLYGDSLNPREPGSGGGYEQGRPGGGLVRITARSVAVDGSILANGSNGANPVNAAGSGGGILLNAGTLAGAGTIAANGGAGACVGYGGGDGGGGRVAVYTWDNLGLPASQISAQGGTGCLGNARPGSVNLAAEPYAAWMEPAGEWLHGVELLAWEAFAMDPAAHTAEVSLSGAGQRFVLGTGLPVLGSLYWESSTVPDGWYELRATVSDATGAVVTEAVREVLVHNALVWHGGRIAADETWAAGPVHLVESTLTVPSGVTLTLGPGVVIKFVAQAGIVVENGGVLTAPAAASSPIVLTSLRDDTAGGDTNLDGNRSLPFPGDWSGVSTWGTGLFDPNAFVELRYHQALHQGALAGNQTWAGTLVHRIATDVTVPSGVTLRIEPGAVLKFNSRTQMTVQAGGHLSAEGTGAQPIYLTSIKDDSEGGDSNRDGNLSSPQAGDWIGLRVQGTARLDRLIMTYGAGSKSGNYEWPMSTFLLADTGSNVTLANSVLDEGQWEGVVDRSGIVISNTVIANTDRAINLNVAATLLHTTLDGNRIGLWCHGGTATVLNSIVSNSSEYGAGACATLSYSNVWSPTTRDHDEPDQAQQNGNISADPHFRDRDGRSYQLDYLSPCIDAADGAVSNATDLAGAPRYDDPRTLNAGLPTAGGAYPDMGAYEFVETAASEVDLIVVAVTGPAEATAGDEAVVRWTVRNAGTQAVQGSWRDRIALVDASGGNLGSVEVVSAAPGQGRLGPSQTANLTATIAVPGGTEGVHYWQVQANSHGDIFEGINWNNNTTQAAAPTYLYVPALTLGVAVAGDFRSAGQAAWYRVEQPAGVGVDVVLDADTLSGRCRLYAKYDLMPSETAFDLRSLAWNAPDARLGIPAAPQDRTVYLLAVPESVGAELGFQILAEQALFALDSLGLIRGGNAGRATVPLFGSGFGPGLAVRLHLNGDIPASAVVLVDSTTALATFDLSGAPLGVYDLTAEQSGETRTLAAAFTVELGSGGELEARLVLPQMVRQNRPFVGMIEFANGGDADLAAPILILQATAANPVWPEGKSQGDAAAELQMIAVSPEGFSGGVLRPGERHTLLFHSIALGTSTQYQLLGKDGDSADLVDWDAYEAAVMPDPAHPLWDEAWAVLESAAGATYGSLSASLAQAADESIGFGVGSTVVQDLLGYMLQREMVTLLANRAGGTLVLSDPVQPGLGNAQPLPLVPLMLESSTPDRTFYTMSWYDGRFGFRDVTPGEYTLTVDGYLPDPAASLTVPASGHFNLMTVTVNSGAHLLGRVVALDNQIPISGAILSAMEMNTGRMQTASSNARGYYELMGLTGGILRVNAVSDQYAAPEPRYLVMPSGGRATLNLEMPSGGTISGRVLGDGQPVLGAPVVAQPADGQAGKLTRSDEEGNYRILGLKPGLYRVVADHDGNGVGVVESVAVTVGQTTDGVDVVLGAAGGLVGTVTDAQTGQPVSQAIVTTQALGWYDEPITTTISGAFSFPGLPPGQQWFMASADDHLPTWFTATVQAGSNTAVVVNLRPAGSISGLVQRPGGAPVSGLTVNLLPVDQAVWQAQTSAAGEFSFRSLPDGEYEVSLGTEGGLSVRRQAFVLDASGNAYTETFELLYSELSGTVYQPGAVDPATGVTVMLSRAGALVASTVTDAAGRYRFLVLQDGPVELAVAGPAVGLLATEPTTLTVGADLVAPPLVAGGETLSVAVRASNSGLPVEQASVLLWPDGPAWPDSAFLDCGTGADGLCVFEPLTPGDYVLEVAAAGLVTRRMTTTVPAGEPQEVSLGTGLVVEGTVRGQDGAPRHAWLDLIERTDPGRAADGNGRRFGAASDDQGHYRLDGLPAGVYDLWVSDGSSQPEVVAKVEPLASAPLQVGVTLRWSGATLTGTVVSSGGLPLAGVQVALIDPAGAALLSSVTDTRGRYTLLHLPAGVATLAASGPGLAPAAVTVTVPISGLVQANILMDDPLALIPPLLSKDGGEAGRTLQPAAPPVLSREGWLLIPASPAGSGAACLAAMGIPIPSAANFQYPSGKYEFYNLPPEPQRCAAWQQNYEHCKRTLKVNDLAFEALWDAYNALGELSCADLNLALANASKLALQTWVTVASMTNLTAKAQQQFTQMLAGDAFKAEAYLANMSSVVSGLETVGNMATAGQTSDTDFLTGMSNSLGGTLAHLIDTAGKQGLRNYPVFQTLWGLYSTWQGWDQFLKQQAEMMKEVQERLDQYRQAVDAYNRSVTMHNRCIRATLSAAASYCQDGPATKPKKPPVPPNPSPQDKKNPPVGTSKDPNDKVTVGVAPEGWVAAGSALLYTIHFENVPTATLPAQQVVITDSLDTDLDWSTIELVSVGFNQVELSVPPGLDRFTGYASVATDPHPVEVVARLEPGTGLLTWIMRTVDWVTGELPADPLAGFLPPNDETGRGQGFVTFRVRPEPTLPEGVPITNQAVIVFDVNESIYTGRVTNTVDSTPPTSSVRPLPAVSRPTLHLSWIGSDLGGSGVASYDIYVADNGAPFLLWAEETTETTAIFAGTPGHTYSFFSVAVDQVGNRQPTPANAQAETTVADSFSVFLPLVRR